MRYDAHLSALSFRYKENSRNPMTGVVLPTLHGRVLCKNWHLCGLCWEECERKQLHFSLEVAATITRLIKKARVE